MVLTAAEAEPAVEDLEPAPVRLEGRWLRLVLVGWAILQTIVAVLLWRGADALFFGRFWSVWFVASAVLLASFARAPWSPFAYQAAGLLFVLAWASRACSLLVQIAEVPATPEVDSLRLAGVLGYTLLAVALWWIWVSVVHEWHNLAEARRNHRRDRE